MINKRDKEYSMWQTSQRQSQIVDERKEKLLDDLNNSLFGKVAIRRTTFALFFAYWLSV